MAKDYLAIYATPVHTERFFSKGANAITHNHCCLDSSTIQYLLELKQYMKFGEDLVNYIYANIEMSTF